MKLIASDKEQVHISVMSGKLKGIPAINTNTLTNEFCQKMFNSGKPKIICTVCFSKDMLSGSRKNCQPSFQRNSDLLSTVGLSSADIPYINSAIMRFSGHGELINALHFINLCTIAFNNPQTTFSLWTKRKDIVINYANIAPLPSNLILIYSNPTIGDPISDVPPYFHKVFNSVPKDYTGDANCTGQKCIDCRLCYEQNDTSVIVEHVKKRN